MNKLFSKKRYTIRDIERLISSQAEESLNLEFKSSGSLNFSDPQRGEEYKTELSRDISAMANSEGGIIIYGIRERNHVAHSKTPIDGTLITKERIEQVIQNRIKRKIPDLDIIPIRENKNLRKSYYIIKIPESVDSPHMAYDGAYYKRNNFNRIQYMEYEIRREYLRKHKVVLDSEPPVVNDMMSQFHKKGNDEVGHFVLWFHISNTGKALETNYKTELLIPKSIYFSGISQSKISAFRTHTFKGTIRFAIPANQTIFPGERLQIVSCPIHLRENDHEKSILIKIYHSNGIETESYSLREIFDEQYKKHDANE